MAFVERAIEVAIKLAATGSNQPNTFAQSGSDVVTLSNLRTSVHVQNSGAAAGSHAYVSIWGLAPALMDQLSTLGMVIQMIPRNTITVTAGDKGSQLSTVFVGTILQAYSDFNSAPDTPFKFECLAGAAENAIPFPASSYTGATSVATVLSTIARQMGWTFENNGVDATIASPYLSGSAMAQVKSIAQAARINAVLINNTLAIWPRYGNRAATSTPLLQPPPDGGLIGYPTYTQQGIMIRNVFDPRIVMGGQVEVRSSLKKASGTWNVLKLDLSLAALLPDGDWMTTLFAYNPAFPSPLPPQTGGTP